MKRRYSSNSATGPEKDSTPRRRRQPQISCNFCRRKKLKCDRAQPCSNCMSRGIPCEGQALSGPSRAVVVGGTPGQPPTQVGPDVLERLQRLEEAVFGPSQKPAPAHVVHEETPASASRGLPLPGQRERSADLDYDHPSEGLALDDCDALTFRVAGSGEHPSPGGSSIRCVDLPSREDTHALFQDYMDNSDLRFGTVIHPPSIRAMIGEVYAQLRQGHRVDLGSAALILSICASSASSWDPDFPAQFNFPSEDHAAAQSHAWRAVAWDLLDQAQRAALHSLDAIHARMVLADMLLNLEGMSARYRYIYACARATAFELKLHALDLPGSGSSSDSLFLREMKRRVWWSLVATDWLLSLMGGAADRTYTVNPQQMRVNYPRYIEGIDTAGSSHGAWSEDSVHHMNVRIRIAEISRDIVDAMPLGGGDVDTLPYSKIEALDKQLEQVIAEWPFQDIAISSPDPVARRIAVQRAVGILSVHARRAKLLRPLLRIRDLAEKFEPFRRQCLRSAEAVMEIASTVLSETVDTPEQKSGRNGKASSLRRPYYSGIVTTHLFMACTVLATDPSLRGGAEGTAANMDPETERRRAQLAKACRLLEKAGGKNPTALGMVKRMLGVLRRHRVPGVRQETSDEVRVTRPPPEQTASYASAEGAPSMAEQQQQQQQMMMMMMMQPSAPGGDVQSSAGPSGVQESWAYDVMDPSGLTGIWNDFLETNPTNGGWDQLFSELDYLSGPF